MLANAADSKSQLLSVAKLENCPPRIAPGGVAAGRADTVLHNGVLVQNHFESQGATAWDRPPQYTAHASKLPIMLQYHFSPVCKSPFFH